MADKTYGMNPDDVKREGQQLQNNANDFLNELNKLVKYNDQLEQIWKGNGSESYFTKWNEKKESITKLQNWLRGFADATVNTATLAQQTDSDVSSSMR